MCVLRPPPENPPRNGPASRELKPDLTQHEFRNVASGHGGDLYKVIMNQTARGGEGDIYGD